MEIKQHSPMPASPHYFRGRVTRVEAAAASSSEMASPTSSTSAPLGLNLSLTSFNTVIKKEPRSVSPMSVVRHSGHNGQGVVGSSTSAMIVDSDSTSSTMNHSTMSAYGMMHTPVHHYGSMMTSSPSPSPAKRSRNFGEECLPSPGQMSVDSVSPTPPQTATSSGLIHSVSSNGYSPSPMSAGSSYDPYSPGGKTGREDLSPPGSVGGYSVDFSGDSKKKKGPVPRQQEELCLVCGDRASGYHYNALTCEGCKGFFRRSITKNAVYQCKYGNGCEIDMYMRRKCQECRLKKCLAVGMRAECVVPEYQCAVKREAKKAQKEKDRPVPTSQNSQSSMDIVKEVEIKQEVKAVPLNVAARPLSSEQEELINRLVYFQEEYDQPSEDDLKKISTSGMHESDAEAKFKHITEMTILTVQLTVEFSKRLPGFDTMLREDQITLLKACSSEVMMLRCARRYDVNTDSIVFANNLPYTRESYNMAGVGDTADPLFRFGRQMTLMKVDNAEYALLTAIVIFSERPGLIESRKVEKIQEIYLEALQAYVTNHRVRPITEFAKLLSVLTELRTLGNLNSEMCFSLKFKNKKLPPFLAEIWDVHG